jgi:hypothetical protein
MTRDDEHLRLLSAFHYVLGGLMALASFLPGVHLAFGVLMVSGRLDTPRGASGAAELGSALLGWFFIGLAALVILCGLALATSLLLAGAWLARRRHYLFCLGVAGTACALVPFGTALGVFTILVLARDSVRAEFGRPPLAATQG